MVLRGGGGKGGHQEVLFRGLGHKCPCARSHRCVCVLPSHEGAVPSQLLPPHLLRTNQRLCKALSPHGRVPGPRDVPLGTGTGLCLSPLWGGDSVTREGGSCPRACSHDKPEDCPALGVTTPPELPLCQPGWREGQGSAPSSGGNSQFCLCKSQCSQFPPCSCGSERPPRPRERGLTSSWTSSGTGTATTLRESRSWSRAWRGKGLTVGFIKYYKIYKDVGRNSSPSELLPGMTGDEFRMLRNSQR